MLARQKSPRALSPLQIDKYKNTKIQKYKIHKSRSRLPSELNLMIDDEKVFCFQNDLRISRVDNVHFLRHLGMKEHNVTLLASTKV